MKLTVPASYTAGKKFTVNGTTYNPGDTVPNATVKGLKRLSAFLGRRIIIPNVDPYNRKRARLRTPTPTDVSAQFRKAL
ncbi:MAG TPA: hypothetical protein VIT65_22270 [Microlunatus sp.]